MPAHMSLLPWSLLSVLPPQTGPVLPPQTGPGILQESFRDTHVAHSRCPPPCTTHLSSHRSLLMSAPFIALIFDPCTESTVTPLSLHGSMAHCMCTNWPSLQVLFAGSCQGGTLMKAPAMHHAPRPAPCTMLYTIQWYIHIRDCMAQLPSCPSDPITCDSWGVTKDATDACSTPPLSLAPCCVCGPSPRVRDRVRAGALLDVWTFT